MSNQTDPLDVNVNDVDLSFPVLVAQSYNLVIKQATKKPNKAQDGELLEIKLATVAPATSTKGEPIAAGYPLTQRISLKETDKYTATMIQQNLARLCKSAQLGGVKLSEVINNLSCLEGKNVVANVGIRKADGQFPEANEIKAFVIPA